MVIICILTLNMNLLTQLSEDSKKSAENTRKRVNRLPFSGFLKSILNFGIILALIYGAVKAFPFVMAWFRQMSSVIK